MKLFSDNEPGNIQTFDKITEESSIRQGSDFPSFCADLIKKKLTVWKRTWLKDFIDRRKPKENLIV